MAVCTRKLEFDAAHRVMRHESKCKHLHGHRYVVEVTCEAPDLDDLGRVIDFGEIKRIVGGWIDENLDHGTIANVDDEALIRVCRINNWKLFRVYGNPTAERIARVLFYIAGELLRPSRVSVQTIRVYETPNSWSDYGVVQRATDTEMFVDLSKEVG